MKKKPKYFPYLDILLLLLIFVFILANILLPYFLAAK